MTRSLERPGRDAAVEHFRRFAPSHDSEPKSRLESSLRQNGIASVDLDIAPDAFQELSDQYAVCIEEHPEWLNWTAGRPNGQHVPEDGHVSKNLETNEKTGMQISDPKNLFHFNNSLRHRWENRHHIWAPREFNEFMDHGFALHEGLVAAARNIVTILDESYHHMSDFYFNGQLSAATFRLLRYDGYDTHDADGRLIVENGAQVAKPHFDRGGMTIQAYASAPGFWCQPHGQIGPKYERKYPPHGIGQSQVFFAAEHFHLYGEDDPIQRLYHGVTRDFDEGVDHVEPRTAAILFVDTPVYDMGITSRDTQPERIDQENLNV